MTQVVSSISGLEIYSPSAGYAPTNSGDVSAIASAYQVVSSTATQLYAGTAYVTSVNGDALSAARAGNAANASLATSAYYDGTGRLISALPDSAAVSSIASSYAESAVSGKADSSSLSSYALSSDVSGCISAVSANSANWTSVYNTVSSNSASWSGSTGGGSVTSPSGTILVMNGNEIEGTNSAVLTASGEAFEQLLWPQNYQLGANMQLLSNATVPYTGTTLMIPLQNPAYADIRVILSGRDTDFGYTSASGIIPLGTNTASIPMDGITRDISASADQWFSLVQTMLTARKEGGTAVTGIGELAWKSAVDNVTNTVSANSASWGGGATGDYVEKSATEVAIGSSNSALNTAFAQGDGNYAENYSFAQGAINTSIDNSFAQGYENSAGNRSFALGGYNIASSNSFAHGAGNTATLGSFAQGSDNSANLNSLVQGYMNIAGSYSFAQGRDISAIKTAAVFGQYNLRGDGSTSTGNSAAFAIGDGTGPVDRHDLMLVTKDGEITMYSSTADTVGLGLVSSIKAISAAATGGIDSATVSSIASSYAESAVSSKQDSSAMSAYALSSDVSGVIDTVSANSASWTTDLTDYATTAYVDSSVSSKLDSSASSSFYTTANESGYVGSAYVDSAVSGKMDSSAIDYTRTGGGTQIYASGTGSSTNQFSAKNDSAGAAIIAGENARLRLWDTAATANLYASSIGGWNAASNLVSSQSANWGGSALALSAGPGVKLEMSGNTLVAGLDETVLFSGGTNGTKSAALTETISNFEWLKVRMDDDHHNGRWVMVDTTEPWCKWFGNFGYDAWNTAGTVIGFREIGFSANDTAIISISGLQKQAVWNSTAWDGNHQTGQYAGIIKVIGINRTAGV